MNLIFAIMLILKSNNQPKYLILRTLGIIGFFPCGLIGYFHWKRFFSKDFYDYYKKSDAARKESFIQKEKFDNESRAKFMLDSKAINDHKKVVYDHINEKDNLPWESLETLKKSSIDNLQGPDSEHKQKQRKMDYIVASVIVATTVIVLLIVLLIFV